MQLANANFYNRNSLMKNCEIKLKISYYYTFLGTNKRFKITKIYFTVITIFKTPLMYFFNDSLIKYMKKLHLAIIVLPCI